MKRETEARLETKPALKRRARDAMMQEPKSKKLRVLMLEDSASDALINECCLVEAGFDVVSERVETREQFGAALRDSKADVILLDYNLPSFEGMAALRMALEATPGIPVIVVTEEINEETAVECMKAGAADYVLKDRLARLPPAVTQALERVAAQEEKRRVEQELVKLQRAVETSGEVMFLTDRDGVFTYVNPQFTRVYGYESAEVVGKKTPGILRSSAHDETFYTRFWSELMSGEVVWQELVNRKRDGSLVCVEGSASPVFDDAGIITAFLAIQKDVTERRQAEEDIVYLASLSEQNPNPVIEVDLEGNVAYMNPAAQSLISSLHEESSASLLTADIESVVETLASQDNQLLEREVQVGDHVFEQKLCYVPGKNCVRIFAHDITERRKLESQLRQAQKMEAVGQLTGGIAHDFNNVLTIIMGNASLIASRLPRELEELRNEMDELQAATQRGAMMTRKLLGFSRRERLEFETTDVGEVVQDLAKILRHLLPSNVEVRTDSEDSICAVEADPGAIEQILLNVATNARDAMPAGGVLRFSARMACLDDNSQATHPWVSPGDYVLLSVSDTGHGMDEATKVRMFEPFFTTKPRDTGTGLGMPMIYGLMKQHGGFVHVCSQVGYGTEVKLYFPVPKVVRQGNSARAQAESLGRFAGHETILVADDEASVRRVAKHVLESHGYSVHLASDGREALDLYRRHSLEIDLVLSDIVMPNLDGRQLYDTLLEQGDDTRFLFTSGYSCPEVRQSASIATVVPFLHKPWAAIDLLTRVREVLGRGGA